MNIPIGETLAENLTMKYSLDRPTLRNWPDLQTAKELNFIKGLGEFIACTYKRYDNREININQVQTMLTNALVNENGIFVDDVDVRDLYERLQKYYSIQDTVTQQITTMLNQDNTGYDRSPGPYEDTFTYKVRNVVLKEFNGERENEPELPLGDFVIRFSLKRLKSAMDNGGGILREIHVNPIGNNVLWNGFYHPHVDQSGMVCFGQANAAAYKAFSEFRFLDGFRLIESILRTYNIESPYPANFPLLYRQWQITQKKTNIEKEVCSCGNEATIVCPSCLTTICEHCYSQCENCGLDACKGCTEYITCASCDKLLCDKCAEDSITCSDCGAIICNECDGDVYVCDCCQSVICEDCRNNGDGGVVCDNCGRIYCGDCDSEVSISRDGGSYCSNCTNISQHICEECGDFVYGGITACSDCGMFCCDNCIIITEGEKHLCETCYGDNESEQNEQNKSNESEVTNETDA